MKRLISLIFWALLLVVALSVYWAVRIEGVLPPSFGKDYTVVRVFDTNGFDDHEISNIRFAAENASEADSEDKGRLWCDAYSYFADIYVTNAEKGLNCKAVVTEGDFFLFHDPGFKQGWYYTADDLHSDRVVIDEKLAFELFGSNDVVDMPLTVGHRTLYVAGVTEYDDSKAKLQQLGEAPVIWIPSHIGDELFGERAFDSYEIMMQNSVDSYAVNALAQATEGKETVDATHRYDLKNSFGLLKSFPTRSYRSEAVKYPYWENDDRGREDVLVILLVITAVTAVATGIQLALFIAERKKR